MRPVIDRLAASGANAFHFILWRMNRSNIKNEGDDTHCPFVGHDPGKPLNEAVLDQWEGWFSQLERAGVVLHVELYDDATDVVLGRLASKVAQILKGKNKPQYTPHVDTGDFVIVINAEKIRLTGNKAAQKMYYSHSGYIGGLKEVSFQRMLEKHPERIIEKAVKGMLPKNSLGRAMNRKLKVYAGPEHPHEAQKPRQITLEA